MKTDPNAYRPDVDGLRAIAVIAVIAFHINAGLLPGGFVGVDVFFVISGYLITGIIAKAMEDGSFTFTDFYTRRIKRIFPAYILVTLFTLAIASFLLIPNDYIFYTTSLAASWAFVSNIFFSMLSWGYFGQRTEEFPLLHTWSLSVEEQFYFVFPILLLCIFRYARKQLIPVLVLLTVIFVVLSEMMVGQVKSYFLITSRAHELLIGALTFFLSRRFPVPSTGVATACAGLGLMLIAASAMFINRGTAFPGLNSLYPCLGAALTIYGCKVENPIKPLLANKFMVGIGLLSYSLYLWHWPILSFLRYRRIEIDLPVGLAVVAASFLLAFLTWKFVENPIRRTHSFNFRRAFAQIYLPPAMLCLAIGLYSYTTEGAPGRFPLETRELIASYSYARDLSRSCSIRAEDYKNITLKYLHDNCAFGAMNQPKAEVLLMGDSHADHFKPFVEQLAKQANLKAVFHVQGSCPPIQLSEVEEGDKAGRATTCAKRNADLLALAGNFRYVVLAGYWSGEYNEADFESSLRRVVDTVVQAGAIPVVFKDNPYSDPDLSQCILHRQRGWIPAGTNCSIPYDFVEKTQGRSDSIIDKVKASYPETIIVDPKRVMCDTSGCATYIGNTALYKDANHLNSKASQLLGAEYVRLVGNPLSVDKPDGLGIDVLVWLTK